MITLKRVRDMLRSVIKALVQGRRTRARFQKIYLQKLTLGIIVSLFVASFMVVLGSGITFAQALPPAPFSPISSSPILSLSSEELLRLPPKTQPVTVNVGLYITNLAQIDQANETANVVGYLTYSWRDQRVAYDSVAQGIQAKPTTLDKIWHPHIEIVNFKSTEYSESLAEIAPNGTITVTERFSKTLSSGLVLQAFPFDRQKILIAVESLQYPAQTVRFQPEPEKISFSKESFATLSEWSITRMTSQATQSFFAPEKQPYSRAAIEIHIRRNSGYYVLKVMTPLLLITIASWSVFWINPREFSTQITIAFTNLLTVVALLLVVNDALPRVGYLTFLDGFTMLCFLGILSAILELLIVHRWELRDQHNRADKIHRIARWLIPGIFMFGSALLCIFTFALGS
jgi:hypothetical protein